MKTQRINLEAPRFLGASGPEIGRMIAQAMDNYTPRKATAAPQRSAQPVKAKAPAKVAPKPAPAPVAPPKVLNRDEVYAKIVQAAGGDVPAKIDALMQTPAGAALYNEYLAAPLAPTVATATPQREVGGIEMAIEQRARKEQLPGETIEAAVVRMLQKYPNLYAAHLAMTDKRR